MDNEQSANENNQAQPRETEEQLIPQSQVNKIVGRTRQEAAEHARRELQAQHQKELESLRNDMAAQATAPEQVDASIGGDPPIDEQAITQRVLESLAQQRHEEAIQEEGRRAARAYEEKLGQGREHYDDFDTVAQQFDANAFPSLVYLMHDIPNAADIVYHLANNPAKAGTLDYVANKSPEMAKKEMLRLAETLSNDRQAKADAEFNKVAPPLDRFQPSHTPSSNGAQSISDLRRTLRARKRK